MANPNNYEKYKHLIGKEINGWLILDIIIRKEDHHVKAFAQCRCGNAKEVRLSYIINNRVKDCGCGHEERLKETIRNKYKYLIDTTINGWTILDIAPHYDKHKATYALCQCECGTIKYVKLSYIINERSKDCGCGRKKTMSQLFMKNLVGQRFGKLVAVELLEERNKNNRTVYKCVCDCGNEVNVLGNSLVMGHTSSCGCLLSYWNLYINNFLKDNDINFRPEYTIWVDDKWYRFDFYLSDYNLFIEYDGQQHYEPVRYYGCNDEENERTFKKIQEHDKIKNKYCEDNNINLLRIPYWETKNIKTIISNHLQRLSEKGFTEVKYATV